MLSEQSGGMRMTALRPRVAEQEGMGVGGIHGETDGHMLPVRVVNSQARRRNDAKRLVGALHPAPDHCCPPASHDGTASEQGVAAEARH